MLPECDGMNIHEKFKKLSALANAGMLTAEEQSELTDHLSVCESCREIHNEYLLLDRQGMPMLAAAFAKRESQQEWDDTAARQKLFARVHATEECNARSLPEELLTVPVPLHAFPLKSLAWAAVAASIAVVIAFGGYRLGHKSASKLRLVEVSADQVRLERLAAEKQAASDLLDSQAKKLSQLEAEQSKSHQQLAQIHVALQAQDERLGQLAASKDASEEQVHAASQQRDSLAARLQSAEQAYEAVRAELANLRAERDKAVLRTASLESKVDELSAVNRDQERRLRNSEQYLSSDRDIRELMGARQLYIADVYDVDSKSRTRKPFGRVFYTQGKSLIFYAFDLDREPGLKNASAAAFQVWGKKSSDEKQPFNLGILYQDNAANRRWVLRFDDPKQLDEINAVFVTVEPNGGSSKPTGKPFLFALLRKEANHP